MIKPGFHSAIKLDYSYTGPPWTLVHYRCLPKITAILALHGHSSIKVPSQEYSYNGPPWTLVHYTGTCPILQLCWPYMDTSPLQVPSRDYSYTGPPWTLVHYRYLPNITAILALHGH